MYYSIVVLESVSFFHITMHMCVNNVDREKFAIKGKF